MDRNTAAGLARDAIQSNGRRPIGARLARGTGRERGAGHGATSRGSDLLAGLPQIAVTGATGWECCARVEGLPQAQRFQVRALYRTAGTRAGGALA